MGVGNGVFHPADFAILNANVAARRLGHAYSAARHRRQPGLRAGAGGELRARRGARLARRPGRRWGASGSSRWRSSRDAARRACTSRQTEAGAHPHAAREPRALPPAVDPAVLRLLRGADRRARSALQTFLPTALNAAFDVPIAIATSAVTTYLLGGTAGIVAGGFLAARFARHDLVAAAGLGARRRDRRCDRGGRSADRRAAAAARAHRLRAGRDRPVARPDRPPRDAAGRVGPRVRLRLLGTGPRRDRGSGGDRRHARRRARRGVSSCWSRRCSCSRSARRMRARQVTAAPA